MRTITIAIIATCLLLPTVLAAPRTLTAEYLNPAATSCATPTVPGNACFRVVAGDTTVRVSIEDDLGMPGLGFISFVASGNVEISRVNFCVSTPALTIPANTATVRVQFYIDSLASMIGCPGQATHGTATATFG